TVDDDLLAFTRMASALRAANPVLRRRRFFAGVRREHELPDIAWFTPATGEMTQQDWDSGFAKSLAVFLNGEAITEAGSRGERIHGASFYLVFNAHWEPLDFVLPERHWGAAWTAVLDTADPNVTGRAPVEHGEKITVRERALLVLRRV